MALMVAIYLGTKSPKVLSESLAIAYCSCAVVASYNTVVQ